MKRRSVLEQLGLSMLLPALSIPPDAVARSDSSRHLDLIVIGAGMAGLKAARELQRSGLAVQILEARPRIGGRVWTSREWPELPMDLGASWIHGVDGNPITALARAAKVRTVATSYERSVAYDAMGAELRGEKRRQFERIEARVEAAIRAAESADQDQSALAAVAGLRHALQDEPDANRIIDFVLNSQLEQEFGGSVQDLSAYWMDDGEGFDGEDHLFPDGYGQLANHLATGLSIALDEPVTRIDWSEPTVRVTTKKRIWTADHVLITVPLGVLKAGRIAFSPALPAAKQRAISGLGMGLLNKCFLRFGEAFWPKDVDWLEHIGATPGHWAEWVSFERAVGAPVLLGFHAAAAARALEAKSDAETVASAMKVLRRIFGTSIPDPIDALITRWASDPFALGAYSFNPVGVHPRLRDDLAASLSGRLHFAGEATERAYFSTVHGAYLSGQHAAAAILESIRA